MRRFAVPVLLALGFALVIGLWFVGRPPAAGSSVQSVSVVSAPVVERFGEWLEAASSPESSTRYDRQGRVLELLRYDPNGGVAYRVVYRYEGERLVEETSFAGERPLYRWRHDYDRQGRKVALSGYGEAGALEFKTVYRYDAQDRLAGETEYAPDESVRSESSYAYDARSSTRETRYGASALGGAYRSLERYDASGNRLEEAAYGEDDKLQYRVVYRYDDAGRPLGETAYGPEGVAEYRLENRYQDGLLVETTEYDRDDEPFYRYAYAYDERGNPLRRSAQGVDGSGSVLVFEYDYDAEGNWVTRRTFRELERFGATVLEPTEVARREVRYFGAASER